MPVKLFIDGGLQILHGVKLYLEISSMLNIFFDTFSTILHEDKWYLSPDGVLYKFWALRLTHVINKIWINRFFINIYFKNQFVLHKFFLLHHQFQHIHFCLILKV